MFATTLPTFCQLLVFIYLKSKVCVQAGGRLWQQGSSLAACSDNPSLCFLRGNLWLQIKTKSQESQSLSWCCFKYTCLYLPNSSVNSFLLTPKELKGPAALCYIQPSPCDHRGVDRVLMCSPKIPTGMAWPSKSASCPRTPQGVCTELSSIMCLYKQPGKKNRRGMLTDLPPFLWSGLTKPEFGKSPPKSAARPWGLLSALYMAGWQLTPPSLVLISFPLAQCSSAASQGGLQQHGDTSPLYLFISFIIPSKPYSLLALLNQTEHKI